LLETEESVPFYDHLSHIEELIISMISTAIETLGPALHRRRVEMLQSIAKPFPKVEYQDTVAMLGKRFGTNLSHREELRVVSAHGDRPVWIINFPEQLKFFNMKNLQDRPELVASADLLLPCAGETVGAAERECDYYRVIRKLRRSTMLTQMRKAGIDIRTFSWYLNVLRDRRVPIHSGCGIGLARMSQFILGHADIRKAAAFPLNRSMIL
jgi:asparaginyl-tRNA synthetase